MPTKSSTRTRKRAEEVLQARDQPTSYRFVGVDCQLLELDEDGKHLNSPKPIFFRPQGAAWVAPVLVTDSKGEEKLKRTTERWDNAQCRQFSGLHSQVRYVYSALERMFFLFRRDFRRGGNEVPPSLDTRSSGGGERLVFAEEFRGALYGSL
ncbi:hypothetical protein N7505_005755 [Penicillium chrysogenum]|uniref:Uncharacterized protein n=1 Tax=Penicillium chrysogenum TaxID=5076 RepID=A0ABQ8WJN8_PENCH|nr:hypothetical protein N7505_005755 [Penicillium chrysogenum]